MRLVLTALGHTWVDLRILEPNDDEEPAPREGWPVDSQIIATDTRIGYIDDVGPGSTFPYE